MTTTTDPTMTDPAALVIAARSFVRAERMIQHVCWTGLDLIELLCGAVETMDNRNEEIYALAMEFSRKAELQTAAWAIEALGKMHSMLSCAIGDCRHGDYAERVGTELDDEMKNGPYA